MCPQIRSAIKAARKSTHASFLHGAILMKGSNIKGWGSNRGPMHAEVSALSGVWPSERKGCTLISVRITKGHGVLANAKPCADCEKVLREAGIKKVIYSTSERTLAEMKL
jgi:tRNA(Arg) A34 adenosine deaminase TadA